MIDYETYCQIQKLHGEQMHVTQIAKTLHLRWETVNRWLHEPYRPAASHGHGRPSKLDPYKPFIIRQLDSYSYSAQQIFQKIKEDGFTGGFTIVKDYVHTVRPKQAPAFLKLAFAPGECAQVDWGCWQDIVVGNTRRRLSFFLLILCYSRMAYLEFFVSQSSEHFLAAHEHAFAALGGVPRRIMVDNLRSAVLRHWLGCEPVFNPKYLAFAHHWGFTATACNVRAGNEKGRVENGVGYVKKNLLAGLELPDFNGMAPIAQHWMDTVANVRQHGATHRRPIDMFEEERKFLLPLNAHLYDIARIESLCVSPQYRISLDANQYSVPPKYVGAQATVKVYPDWVCIYVQDQLVARHHRNYDRHQDIEDPDHTKVLEQQRRHAIEQRVWLRYSKISPLAMDYYRGLVERRANAHQHVRKIVALTDICGVEAVAQAIKDAIALEAFSSEYIANILETRHRIISEASPLKLLRRQDLLEIDLEDPDLSQYQVPDHEKN